MTQEQAQAVLNSPELKGKATRLHRIGNGEYVVIVRRRGAGDYYLWGEADLAAIVTQE